MLAWAADFTMGAAVYSTLPAGDLFATLDIHIRFMRPAAIDDGDITLTSRVHHRGRQLSQGLPPEALIARATKAFAQQ